MKKPKGREFLAALILCTALFSAIFIDDMNSPSQSDLTLRPLLSSSSQSLSEQYGLQGSFTIQTPNVEAQDERVKDIRQWIKGELKNGTFEDVVMSIEEETDSLGGYIESEDVTFADDVWSGEIVSKVPQNNSLRLVFKVRSLISTNGKVTSITTNIRDITPPQGVSIAKPFATIRVTLREGGEKSGQPLPRIELPFLATIAAYLGTFFTWVVTGLIIGLPAYFTILGIVLLVDRALFPIANKLFKRDINKNSESLQS